MRSLAIDARKSRDAGIGTYLRQLVPRVLAQLPEVSCTLWIAPGDEDWLQEVRARSGRAVEGVVLPARPLSLKEQPLLRRLPRPGQLVWAPSLAHALFHRAPMVATVHDVAQLALPPAMAGGRFTQAAARVFFQSLRRSAREILFVSEFTRSEFRRLVGEPRQPTTVTPLGVDPDWFPARDAGGRPQAKPYFISVSSVRPHKNFGFLVRAFAQVAPQLAHDLVIVGESEGLRTVDSQLLERVGQLGGRVRFLGRLPDAELRRWVAHADAMVFPSLYEGFGLPPLEAMAAGCPVLCSTAGSLQEVCKDAAVYFDPRNAASLQQCLLQQSRAADADRAERVAIGLQHARSYRWERTADLTRAVLERALQAEEEP